MRYQSSTAAGSKFEYARRAAATLAYLVLHHQDSVGLVTFDSEIRSLIRAGGNPSHLKDILQAMEARRPNAKPRSARSSTIWPNG